MTYVYFQVEFQTPQQLHELNRPVEVVRAIVNVIRSDNLQGYNFNRYYSPEQGIPNPRIDLRLNLNNLDEALAPIRRGLEEQVRAGRIARFSADHHTWTEPEFVVDAHEAATTCAIQFVDAVADNQALSRALRDNAVEVMLNFFRLLFESLALQPYVAWGYLRNSPPEGLVEVARNCTGRLMDVFGRQTRRADFLERFVHLFLNCTVGATEQAVVNSLLLSMLWKTLAQRHVGEST